MNPPAIEYCPVCGVIMALRGFPYSATHIWTPVTDVARGIDYPGHRVTPKTAEVEA